MVRTTKGPAEKSKPDKAGKESPAEKPEMARPNDIDDATWGRIESMARSQQTTTGTVIRRAIENQYGVAPTEGVYHSGMDNDPSKV